MRNATGLSREKGDVCDYDPSSTQDSLSETLDKFGQRKTWVEGENGVNPLDIPPKGETRFGSNPIL